MRRLVVFCLMALLAQSLVLGCAEGLIGYYAPPTVTAVPAGAPAQTAQTPAQTAQGSPKRGGGLSGGSSLDAALLDAVSKGDFARMQALLAQGANVNAGDKDGTTPLMMAAINGHVSVVQAILDKGADVNARDKDGFTALWDAASEGHLQVVHVLLARGADVNARNNEGKTILSELEHGFLAHPGVSREAIKNIINALKRAGAR